MKIKKSIVSIGMATVLLVSPMTAFAQNAEPNAFTKHVMEWEEQGIDANHTEVRNAVLDYIEQHIEPGVFASLHIDREERPLGILVYSFTEPISEEHQQAMRELVSEPAKIAFREVTYTEDELIEKQREVDAQVFELEDITVYHTSLDIIGNQIEIGVEEPTEEVVQKLHELFGEEMISVVQGMQATLLGDSGDDSSGAAENEQSDSVEDKTDESNDTSNILLRAIMMITSLFQKMF